jgi:hypothetical protein
MMAQQALAESRFKKQMRTIDPVLYGDQMTQMSNEQLIQQAMMYGASQMASGDITNIQVGVKT